MRPFAYERPGYDLHEFFADEFAAALLMPPEDVAKQLKLGRTPTQMAERYDVTISAVKAWIQRLERHPMEKQ